MEPITSGKMAAPAGNLAFYKNALDCVCLPASRANTGESAIGVSPEKIGGSALERGRARQPSGYVC